jgi:hypothetical protein
MMPAGSAARPRRVILCISKPPVRCDAGAVLTHEVKLRYANPDHFPMRQNCNVAALSR